MPGSNDPLSNRRARYQEKPLEEDHSGYDPMVAEYLEEKQKKTKRSLDRLKEPYAKMFGWAEEKLQDRDGGDLHDPETVAAMALVAMKNSNSARDIMKYLDQLRAIYGHNSSTIKVKGTGLAKSESDLDQQMRELLGTFQGRSGLSDN